jgi:hypothetical protein
MISPNAIISHYNSLSPAKQSDYRLSLSNAIGVTCGSIAFVGTFVGSGIAAHKSAEQRQDSIITAEETYKKANRAEMDFVLTLPNDCSAFIAAYRADFQTHPDETIATGNSEAVCGENTLTTLKNASNLTTSTETALADWKKKESSNINYPAFVIGALFLGGFGAGIAKSTGEFGSWCVLDSLANMAAKSEPKKYRSQTHTQIPAAKKKANNQWQVVSKKTGNEFVGHEYGFGINVHD